MQELGYVALAIAFVGIALGLYGIFLPNLRQMGFAFPLHRRRSTSAEPEATGARQDLTLGDEALVEDEEDEEDAEEEEERDSASFHAFGADAEERRVGTPEPLPHRIAEPALRVKETEFEDAVIETPESDAVIETPQPDLDDETAVDASLAAADKEAAEEGQKAAAEPEKEAGKAAAANTAAPAADDIMALFRESQTESAAPPILRDAIEEITIEQLLAEARAVRGFFSAVPPKD